MRRFCALLLALALDASLAQDRKKRAPKPPDLEVVEASAHRGQGTIALDGRVRNSGVRPISGLVLIFDFMATGRAVITTQKARADDEYLEPGAESVFRVELKDHVRAVSFQIQAADKDGRELTVAKTGPFPIE
ncbi:MAG: hypothetical protein ACRD96_23075 [Bryobacteraceae bacterium]